MTAMERCTTRFDANVFALAPSKSCSRAYENQSPSPPPVPCCPSERRNPFGCSVAFYNGQSVSMGGVGSGNSTAPSNPYQMIRCTGVGRGLAGNTNLVGRQGGIPGQTVQLNTAAVTPTQFNVPNGAALSPFAPYINGTVGNARFNSITDVNGGKSPIPGVPVRLALQQLFPGQLILEIPGAKDQGANAPVSINVPQSLGCPAGTHP
jgi:hypothetical protein